MHHDFSMREELLLVVEAITKLSDSLIITTRVLLNEDCWGLESSVSSSGQKNTANDAII